MGHSDCDFHGESVNRKQRRAAAQAERKHGNNDLAEKMGIYAQLPDYCLMCEAPFDKTDREMLSSWNVVVREKEGVVRLYCPDCLAAARQVVDQYEQEVRDENNS